MNDSKRKRQAKTLRTFRKIHRTTGAVLFLGFFLVSVTGLLLGWKKNSYGIILAKSYAGKSTNPQDWLPISVLEENAKRIAREQISPDLSLKIDRIDIRPDKGMAKFVFVEGYWGVQLDCTTGEALHIERRRADFVENIHDGSILDYIFNTEGYLKLAYTTIMGLALLLFTITGFWLWYGPKRMKSANRETSEIP
jgi:uncharacterized iron-regulated membrane protein